ncbi:MAG: recombination protein RecR [Bacteroidaceae bacterium]|nr:recombination protein RecR [Bacteroidaceae bacterium]
MEQNFASTLLENAVNEFAKLPGIGRKTALRLVLHLLRQEKSDVDNFSQAITRLRHDIKYCNVCHNISDTDTCALCADTSRDSSTICVVENVREVMAVEATGQFRGLYHVLGGVISPMDGIGPADLQIESLVQRVAAGGIKEIILALSATMEGDTTNFYIFRKLAPYDVRITLIARGVSVGDELEYTDEITLGRSILNRTPFGESFKS